MFLSSLSSRSSTWKHRNEQELSYPPLHARMLTSPWGAFQIDLEVSANLLPTPSPRQPPVIDERYPRAILSILLMKTRLPLGRLPHHNCCLYVAGAADTSGVSHDYCCTTSFYRVDWFVKWLRSWSWGQNSAYRCSLWWLLIIPSSKFWNVVVAGYQCLVCAILLMLWSRTDESLIFSGFRRIFCFKQKKFSTLPACSPSHSSRLPSNHLQYNQDPIDKQMSHGYFPKANVHVRSCCFGHGFSCCFVVFVTC